MPVFLVLTVTSAQDNCLTSSDGVETCYTLHSTRSSFENADAECRNSNEILARVENDQQSDLIQNLVTSSLGSGSVWIGGRVFDHSFVDMWRWIDGWLRKMSYKFDRINSS